MLNGLLSLEKSEYRRMFRPCVLEEVGFELVLQGIIGIGFAEEEKGQPSWREQRPEMLVWGRNRMWLAALCSGKSLQMGRELHNWSRHHPILTVFHPWGPQSTEYSHFNGILKTSLRLLKGE